MGREREGKPSAGSPCWQHPARGSVTRRPDDRNRRGDPSPAPFLRGDPSTLVFGNVSSFAGGGGNEDLGRPGGYQPSRARDSNRSRTRVDDRGCSGPFREEGIPRRTTPLRSGAHGTFALPTGSCSQASAHVACHDGAASRRKTARREEVVGSVDERRAVGETRCAAPWPVRRRLVPTSWREPETRENA